MQYPGLYNHVSRAMDLHLDKHSKYVISLKHSKSMSIAEIENCNNIPGITTKIQRETKAYLNWLLYLPRAKYTTQPNCMKYTSSSLVWITNAKSYQSELEQLHVIHLYQMLGFQMKTSIEFVQINYSLLIKFQQVHFQHKRLCYIQRKCAAIEFLYLGANMDCIASEKNIPASCIHSHNTWTVIQNCKSFRILLLQKWR